MKQSLRLLALGLVVILTGWTARAQETNIMPGELIIQMQWKKDVQAVVAEFNDQLPGAELIAERELSRALNVHLLKFNHNEVSEAEALMKLKFHPDVALVQYNHTNVALRDTCVNDPDFGQQWAHCNDGTNGSGGSADMKSCDAWNITTGGTTVAGDKIVVAVIDGSFDVNHTDINFWSNTAETPNNGIDDDNNGYIDDVLGWNPSSNDDDILPAGNFDNHGTHVAGIVGATGNNNTGVVGVNHNVEVMGIAGSSGNEATVVAAYGYALEQRRIYNNTNGASGAFVVSTNSSFGVDNADPNNYPLWCAFYDSLGAYGILSAGATSNSNTNVDQAGDVPTACPSDYMISVTNTNSQDQRNGSGYGATTIDMGAPGTDIYSTVPSDGYSSQTGTSMATPQVAGAIGLMWSVACQTMLDDYKANPAQGALAMRDLLLNYGLDNAPDLVGETVTGGRLNLWLSVTSIVNYPGCFSVGVAEQAPALNFTVMPNPNHGQFKVALGADLYGQHQIEVRNVLGQVVASEMVMANGTEQTVAFDLGSVESGAYLVRLSDQTQSSAVAKVIVR